MGLKDKIDEVLDKTEIDDKIKEKFSDLKDKITGKDDEEAPKEE